MEDTVENTQLKLTSTKTNYRVVSIITIIVLSLLVGIGYYLESKQASEEQSAPSGPVVQEQPILPPDPATEEDLLTIMFSISEQKKELEGIKQGLDVELEKELDLRLKSSIF